jgi:ligand-binding SRPBCC domain-containing protein
MRTHIFQTSMRLARQIDQVFSFFCDVLNLERITPPELNFHILTPQPIEITEGTIVDYRLRLYGIPLRWRSKITTWDPPRRFVDEQILGPYCLWIHTHRFYEENDSTIVEDDVLYRLPLWPLGELAFPLINCHLRRIFRYRHEAIMEAFGISSNSRCNEESKY